MLKVAEWQLKNPKHELNDWTNGAFYAGIFAAPESAQSNFSAPKPKPTRFAPESRFSARQIF